MITKNAKALIPWLTVAGSAAQAYLLRTGKHRYLYLPDEQGNLAI